MSNELKAAGIQAAGDIGAAIVGSYTNKKEGKRAWRRTKVLNQNQIQWRVADAQRAGVSPLAALGMSPIGQFPMTSSGDLAADAVRGVGDAAAGYFRSRGARAAETAALRESSARTAEALSAAERNKAEADHFKTMQFDMWARRLAGSSGMGNASAAQRIYGDLEGANLPNSPGVGSSPILRTGFGDIPLNPNRTPHELGEAAIGEAMNVFSLMNLADSLATKEGVEMLAKGAYERTPIGRLLKNYSLEDIKGFLRMVDAKLSEDIDWSGVKKALEYLERDLW